jgi:hypothetical protein
VEGKNCPAHSLVTIPILFIILYLHVVFKLMKFLKVGHNVTMCCSLELCEMGWMSSPSLSKLGWIIAGGINKDFEVDLRAFNRPVFSLLLFIF